MGQIEQAGRHAVEDGGLSTMEIVTGQWGVVGRMPVAGRLEYWGQMVVAGLVALGVTAVVISALTVAVGWWVR